MPRLQTIHTCREIRQAVLAARASGRTVGLVPTMGALHEGHLSLVRAARQACDVTVVSIFVNPTQFGPQEDFAKYPRTLESDAEKLAALETDWVFAPSQDEMYPANFTTYVDPPDVSRRLEGECRPGHFRGVATVVLKLFHVVPADVAYFGQKDYQQSLVIRRMVEDLGHSITIQVCPIVRDSDGLALSSRNAYLDGEQRCQATALSRGLDRAEDLVQGGERDAGKIRQRVVTALQDAGITRIDYVSCADPDTLDEVHQIDQPTIVLIAAHVGQTRLIDNRKIG